MLTALSVARDCHMIEHSGKVILVQCLLPSQHQQTAGATNIDVIKTDQVTSDKPQLQFTYADDESQRVVFDDMMMTSEASERKSPNDDDPKSTPTSAIVEIDDADRIHFAMTGKSWALVREHFPEVVARLVVRGTVFARFSPEQKQQLIEALQDVG